MIEKQERQEEQRSLTNTSMSSKILDGSGSNELDSAVHVIGGRARKFISRGLLLFELSSLNINHRSSTIHSVI